MTRTLASTARSGVAMGFIASFVLLVWVLVGLRGWWYYTTPLAVRAYSESHRLLRPSGPIGQTLGVAGAVMMLVPFAYMVRKRLRRGSHRDVARAGSRSTSSAASSARCSSRCTPPSSSTGSSRPPTGRWSSSCCRASSAATCTCGFREVLRGAELTRAELDAQAASLHDAVIARAGAAHLVSRIDGARAARRARGRAAAVLVGLLFGEIAVRSACARSAQPSTAPAGSAREIATICCGSRPSGSSSLRRTAYLQRTKTAFALWHVFHLPLVYAMLVIVVAHVGAGDLPGLRAVPVVR